MIFGKTKLELKVGVFVVVGLTVLAIFILSIGGVRTWASGYKFSVTFHFINGIKLGAPVRFAGVDVGEVKEIEFVKHGADDSRTRVKVTCWVRKEVQIPLDSTVWVNTLGLLGEKYVEIMPGKDYTKLLAPNQKFCGKDPMPMHEVTELAKGIADDLKEMIEKVKNKEGSLGLLLYDDALYRSLEAAIGNKDGTIGRFFYDDTVYKETEALIKDIRAHPWKLLIRTKEKKIKK